MKSLQSQASNFFPLKGPAGLEVEGVASLGAPGPRGLCPVRALWQASPPGASVGPRKGQTSSAVRMMRPGSRVSGHWPVMKCLTAVGHPGSRRFAFCSVPVWVLERRIFERPRQTPLSLQMTPGLWDPMNNLRVRRRWEPFEVQSCFCGWESFFFFVSTCVSWWCFPLFPREVSDCFMALRL